MMSFSCGFFSLLFLTCATGILAQSVTQVTAVQQGQVLVVSYALESDGPVEVDLFVSIDQGKNWQGPLSNCSGDVGNNVLAGTSKRIRWALLEERELVGDGIRFKVVARGEVMKPWLNPKLSYGSVMDIDGNTYATIQIGKQVWMAENLRTSRYRNGDNIWERTDGETWARLATGAWAHYNNDSQNEQPYGKLYNWFTVADHRKVCPVGWHVPSDGEWRNLTTKLGEGAGGGMKATSLWVHPNTAATNESGFSGLPGGYRSHNDGSFGSHGSTVGWWSNSESGGGGAWMRSLGSGSSGIGRYDNDKRVGFCLRCIQD